MSLPLRQQPFQSPADYIQSPREQQGFFQWLQGHPRPLLPIGYYWEKFSNGQVTNVMERMQPTPALPLSQHFMQNSMNIVDGQYQKQACCNSCGNSRVPFSCTKAQGSQSKCPGKSQLYLYNDQYLCCTESPYGETAKKNVQQARNTRQNRTPKMLAEPRHLDPFTQNMKAKAQQVFGNGYREREGNVYMRVSTS